MNNNNKMVITVVAVITLFVTVIGATFAYFSATSESEVFTPITSSTATNLVIAAEGTTVDNLKPIVSPTTKAEGTASEFVAKIPFNVSGSADNSGSYTIKMSATPALNTGNDEEGNPLAGGAVADIKYAVYDAAGEIIGSVKDMPASSELIATETFTATGVDDDYEIHVWIEGKDAAQNQLQGISFDVALSGSATSN